MRLLAWQYGMGCMKPMPKDEELQQMPGRGKLDFTPLLKALKDINYAGLHGDLHAPDPARHPDSADGGGGDGGDQQGAGVSREVPWQLSPDLQPAEHAM